MGHKTQLLKIALFSRLSLIGLQYIFNHIIPDHDAGVFIYPKQQNSTSIIDVLVLHLFGGFIRWDAQYFMLVAKHGYTYENTAAFFPLLPMLTSFITRTLRIDYLMTLDSALLLVYLTLNFLFFILSVFVLLNLTQKMFNERIAYITCILFCFNPASIFFMAPYTECLFSYLSFKSMENCIFLYKKYSNFKISLELKDLSYLIPISLSAVTRSNGLLNVGFVLYILISLFLKKVSYETNNFSKLLVAAKYLGAGTAATIFCLFPFVAYQFYCFSLFCSDFIQDTPEYVLAYAVENDLVLPGTFSIHNQTWCYKNIPLAYSYVQDHYWNVGFLRYFELKQLPNFLLASPIIYIIIKNSVKYLCMNCPYNIRDIFEFEKVNHNSKEHMKYASILVFVVHALTLTLFCIFFIHIQVTTRMLCSASPVLYWYCSFYFLDGEKLPKTQHHGCSFKETPKLQRVLLVTFFLGYFIVGTALFSNHLPWT